MNIKNYIMKLDGNALICICFHPLWGIPYTLYYYYLSMYMKEFGVTDGQLGLLMTVGAFVSIPFSLAAAPIVDKLGRKRSTFWFDIISSALPPLLFFISGNFSVSLVAIILSNANKIMSVSYYLIMVEDANDEQRIIAFNLFNIITVASGVLIPIVGYYVDVFGVLKTERVFLLIAFFCMTGLILARNQLLKETKNGEEIRLSLQNSSFKLNDLLQPYRNAISYLSGNRIATATVVANILFYIYYIIGTNNSLYFVPYFSDALALDTSKISLFGAVYSISILFSMIVINPLTSKLNIFVNLIAGAIINTAGMVLLAFLPKGMFLSALAAVLITSLGFGFSKSLIDAALAITTEGEARSGIYSLVNTASAVFGMLATGICGMIYPINPRIIYIISSILLVVSIYIFSRVLISKKYDAIVNNEIV